MSREAEIAARLEMPMPYSIVQYGTDANPLADLRYLLAALQQAREALEMLKRDTCWCEVAIGNPMYEDHDRGCKAAQVVMKDEGR